MRKVTFGGGCSLDGFLARADGGLDWLMWSDEVTELMADFWPRIDTIVMGRKTYTAATETSSDEVKEAAEANPYTGLKTYIFSRTLEPGVRPSGEEILADDPGEFVRDLKQQDGKDICIMGGGDLAKTLLEAGVIDEIGFNIHPILLGSGVPVFHEMSRSIDLELVECKPLKNGCVYVLYTVKNQ